VARYTTPVTSVAALAVDTAFAAITGSATQGGKIRRVIIGTVAGTGAVNDMQLVFGINRASARGTATTTLTPGKLDTRTAAATITGIDTVWSVAPTLAAQDLARIPFNAKSGVDLPWEMLEELCFENSTTIPVVFVNRVNALPASTSYVVTIEHEE
jgi:hypothetical protein